jgi:hypothetical protein
VAEGSLRAKFAAVQPLVLTNGRLDEWRP